MEVKGNLSKIVSELMIEIKNANTQWMENNIESIYKNREKKENLELDLQETIKKRKAHIQQELDRLAMEYEGELERLEMKIQQENQNYKDFLKELDTMKTQIVAAFKSAPPTIPLLIHRHASELLNSMWNESNIDKRRILEGQLLDLFNSVSDDVKKLKASQENTYLLPEKTITLIKGK